MKKLGAALAVLTALALGPAASAFAQSETSEKRAPLPRWEFRLTLGLAVPGGVSASQYRDAWTQDLLSSVVDQTTITPLSPDAFSCLGTASYFFTRRLGVQAALGIYSESLTSTSEFGFTYTWKSGASGSKYVGWPGTGRLKSVPFCLNAVYGFGDAKWSLYIAAGPALYFNSYLAESMSGFGISETVRVRVFIPPNWVETVTQELDALPVPLSVPARSWVKLGWDIAAAADFSLGGKWALTAEIRYLKCPAKEIEWTWTPGTYDGILGVFTAWPFTSVNAVYAAGHTAPTTVRPSSLRIGVGIKLSLI